MALPGMRDFIILHDKSGDEVFISLDHIIMVYEVPDRRNELLTHVVLTNNHAMNVKERAKDIMEAMKRPK